MIQEDTLKLYLKEHSEIVNNFPIKDVARLVQAIEEVHRNYGRVFIFGNGGGASIADHFASDLAIHPFVSENKRNTLHKARLIVHCLNESASLLTRLSNDIGYEFIFMEQLKCYSPNKRDLIIALSTSGNSYNILYALRDARGYGATTALIGGRDGGKAKEFADICILIPGSSQFPGQIGTNDNCFHIEDFQAIIAHIVTGLLKEGINEVP